MKSVKAPPALQPAPKKALSHLFGDLVSPPSYRLKQRQYRAIYQANEHAVRALIDQGAPLDDPAAMLATFLPAVPGAGVIIPATALEHYRRELELAAQAASSRPITAAAKALAVRTRTQVIRIPGPLIADQARSACILIKRNLSHCGN